MAVPCEEDLRHLRCAALPEGPPPPSRLCHTGLSHFGLPLKCYTLDRRSVAVFDMEMKPGLPVRSQGMEVVICESRKLALPQAERAIPSLLAS